MTASRAAACLLAAGGLALLLASTAVAQTKGDIEQPAGDSTVTTTTTRHGGWTVVCTRAANQEKEICNASFRVINNQNKANLLVWLFGLNAQGEKLTEFRTLTEVRIQPGVVVELEGSAEMRATYKDSEPLRAAYVACGTGGCQASLNLDGDMIERLTDAKTATISMTRSDGQVIQMKMDVTGIDLALRDLGF
jgi:invasion protein IalB